MASIDPLNPQSLQHPRTDGHGNWPPVRSESSCTPLINSGRRCVYQRGGLTGSEHVQSETGHGDLGMHPPLSRRSEPRLHFKPPANEAGVIHGLELFPQKHPRRSSSRNSWHLQAQTARAHLTDNLPQRLSLSFINAPPNSICLYAARVGCFFYSHWSCVHHRCLSWRATHLHAVCSS